MERAQAVSDRGPVPNCAQTPVLIAAFNGHDEAVEKLIAAKCNVETPTGERDSGEGTERARAVGVMDGRRGRTMPRGRHETGIADMVRGQRCDAGVHCGSGGARKSSATAHPGQVRLRQSSGESYQYLPGYRSYHTPAICSRAVVRPRYCVFWLTPRSVSRFYASTVRRLIQAQCTKLWSARARM
eukprot:629205-Rhodomonas_salina.1